MSYKYIDIICYKYYSCSFSQDFLLSKKEVKKCQTIIDYIFANYAKNILLLCYYNY